MAAAALARRLRTGTCGDLARPRTGATVTTTIRHLADQPPPPWRWPRHPADEHRPKHPIHVGTVNDAAVVTLSGGQHTPTSVGSCSTSNGG